jgi:hypothetical protein
MNDRTKWFLGATLMVSGTGLIGWNLLHDPDRGFRETDVPDEPVAIDQVPPSVKQTIQRESAGGTVQEIERETKQGQVTYEVEIHRGGREIEVDVAEDGAVLKRDEKRLKAKTS